MESGMAIKATLIIISNSLKILRSFVKNLNQKKKIEPQQIQGWSGHQQWMTINVI